MYWFIHLNCGFLQLLLIGIASLDCADLSTLVTYLYSSLRLVLYYCMCLIVHSPWVFVQLPQIDIVFYIVLCWFVHFFFFSFCVVTADWFCTSMFRYSLVFVSHVLIVQPDGAFLQLLLIDSVWFTCSDFSPDGAFLQLPLIDSVCFTCSDFLTRWRFCPLRSIDIMFHMCCFLSRDCGFAQFQQINVILSQYRENIIPLPSL